MSEKKRKHDKVYPKYGFIDNIVNSLNKHLVVQNLKIA